MEASVHGTLRRNDCAPDRAHVHPQVAFGGLLASVVADTLDVALIAALAQPCLMTIRVWTNYWTRTCLRLPLSSHGDGNGTVRYLKGSDFRPASANGFGVYRKLIVEHFHWGEGIEPSGSSLWSRSAVWGLYIS